MNSAGLVKDGYIFAGWNTDEFGTGTYYAEESIYTDNASLVLYAMWMVAHFVDMVYVPAGKFKPGNTGTDVAIEAFALAETELTWEQWKNVYDWATINGYTFANTGKNGWGNNSANTNHPVTYINWYDAVVWCNAATEMANAQNGTSIKTVYNDSSGDPIRNSRKTTILDTVSPDDSAKGYRLPTSHEWEYAARYKKDGTWTAVSYGSGQNDENAIGDVAWYFDNSSGTTHPVGIKQNNELGMHDMSGNVFEWCFDLHPDDLNTNRVLRGGDFLSGEEALNVGLVTSVRPAEVSYGFRPACAP